MKWTYDWLTDYLKTDAAPDVIADTLTRIGLEIDDCIAPVAPIAAKIVDCKPHENSDHLHVLMVDAGDGNLIQVVCGAPNARVGLISALARVGTIIDGHEIQSGKLRGVMSNGMMCSGRELGINDDHSGIIELPADTVLGAPVVDMPIVFDAGITPNRPDYLAVRGIARDLNAAGIGEYVADMPAPIADVPAKRAVDIRTDKCPVYRMVEIHGIKMAPSADKIARRLRAIGINPKNACVDATNYICYDMAQPMHCFDADEIDGDIIVRMATDGEEFTDLFGTEHKLTSNDMVIADARGLLAVAGVVGGRRAACTDTTTNIILESAYFDPVSVRKSAKRLGMSTDASYRYERGIDPTTTAPAAAMATRIIMDACGGKIVGTVTAGKNPSDERRIKYSPDMFARLIGIDVAPAVQLDILNSLGYTVNTRAATWVVVPPAARVDVEIPQTVIADIARIYGYDKISAVAQHRMDMPVSPHYDHAMGIREILCGRGLNECRSYSFGNSQTESILGLEKSVMVANPIVADMNTARGTLIGGLLDAVLNNERRGYPDLNLFEIGTVFTGDAPGDQKTSLAIVRTGATGPRHWTGRNRPQDIYDVRADITALMQAQRFTISSDNPPVWAHPYRYGRIMQGKKTIAEFGQLSPIVARQLKIKTPVMIAIVDDINNIPARKIAKYVAMPEFPPITRDFAFITDADFPAGQITATATAADARIIDTTVFDAFDMGDGKKSIAFTITVQPDKNMSDADMMEIQNAVIAAVEKKCPAKIRDK